MRGVQPTSVIAGGLLVMFAFAAFLPGVSNHWIHDDFELVLKRIDEPVAVTDSGFWTEEYWGRGAGTGLYRPLTLTLFALQRVLFGSVPAGFHVISIALHATCTLLVWRLLALLFPTLGPWVRLTAAAFFAVHPIHAEAVLPAYGQADLLASAFTLTALILLIEAGGRRTEPVFVVGALAAAFLGLCSKESAVVVLPLGLAAHFLTTESKAPPWRYCFLFVPVAAYVVLKYWALGYVALPAESSIFSGYGLTLRIKMIIVSLGHYIRLCVFPTGQTVYYGHLRESLLGWPVREAAWILMSFVVLNWLPRLLPRRFMVAVVFWFLITVVPILNVIAIGAFVPERSLYLPVLAACSVAAYLIVGLTASSQRWRSRQTWMVVGLLATMLIASWTVCRHWHDQESLWRTTAKDHPRSPQAHVELGRAVLNRLGIQGLPAELAVPVGAEAEIQDAARSFHKALELNPRSSQAHVGLAVIAFAERRPLDACTHLRQAYELRPEQPELREYLRACP